ncbi:MAG: RNA polymerase sigma factor [Bacillota bacterium]
MLMRYRSQAVRWAGAVVRDPHLAEDIAQEALMQAITKLDQLQEPARFAGWLRQAVRRFALNRMKRARREIMTAELADESFSGRNITAVTGTDIGDPLETVARQESLQELLSGALAALSPRAGAIMRDVAFEAETEELMERFALTKGNLYNIISRSRAKAGEERFHIALEAYLTERRRNKHPHSAMLRTPEWPRPYSMFGFAVHEAMRYASDASVSVTETMSLSGEAFRLSVTNGCHWRGISTFDWTFTAQRAMERLGREAMYFTRKRNDPITPERHLHLLRLVHDSVDRGIPVVVWNLVINEFGLLYGYDDRSQTLHYRGFRQRAEPFAYMRLGRGNEEPELFALAVGKRSAPQATDGMMIDTIIKHAKGEEAPVAGFAFGLDGYLLWRDAAERETLDPLGHAYQVAILCEAREHAVAYLQLLSERAKTVSRRKGLAAAAECYVTALKSLQRLYPSFPYGYGTGTGHNGSGPNGCIPQGIAAACQAEREAIMILQRL